jgi:hypothetical protein
MTSKEFLLEAQAFILNHLADLQIWRDLICSRYPGISQRQPGLWVLGQSPDCFDFKAPALLILRNRSSLDNFKGKIKLGPFSAFIFEGQKLDLQSSQELLEIENGVFYVQDSQTSPVQIEGNIQGALFIK